MRCELARRASIACLPRSRGSRRRPRGFRRIDDLGANPRRVIRGRHECEVRLVRQSAHLNLVTAVSRPPEDERGNVLKFSPENRGVEQDPAHPILVHRNIADSDEPLAMLGIQVLDFELRGLWYRTVDVPFWHCTRVVRHGAYPLKGAGTSMRQPVRWAHRARLISVVYGREDPAAGYRSARGRTPRRTRTQFHSSTAAERIAPLLRRAILRENEHAVRSNADRTRRGEAISRPGGWLRVGDHIGASLISKAATVAIPVAVQP